MDILDFFIVHLITRHNHIGSDMTGSFLCSGQRSETNDGSEYKKRGPIARASFSLFPVRVVG
jgi:hypothetical protein